MTAYFGITAHYISCDWELKTALLSFAELSGSHSGENQANHIYAVLKHFGIVHKVCLKVVLDIFYTY